MIHNARDLSPEQKIVVESLLGRPIADNEAISIRAAEWASVPDWLNTSWDSAKQLGVSKMSAEEIDAEILAARMARRDRKPAS
jgi:hypothetical protein